MRKRWLTIGIIGIAALAVVVGTAARLPGVRDNRAFQTAARVERSAGKDRDRAIAAYRVYLASYRSGRHSAEAKEAIGRLETETVRSLVKAFNAESRDDERRAIARKLASRTAAEAVPVLTEVLLSRQEVVVNGAASLAAVFCHDTFVQTTRLPAAVALIRGGDDRALAALRRAAEETGPTVDPKSEARLWEMRKSFAESTHADLSWLDALSAANPSTLLYFLKATGRPELEEVAKERFQVYAKVGAGKPGRLPSQLFNQFSLTEGGRGMLSLAQSECERLTGSKQFPKWGEARTADAR